MTADTKLADGCSPGGPLIPHARRPDLTPPVDPTAPAAGAGDAPPPRARIRSRPRWQRRYVGLAFASDIAALTVSACSYGLWGTAPLADVVAFGGAVAALALACLLTARAWDTSVLGHGSAEFTRLLNGFVGAGLIVALGSLALQHSEGRPWVFGFLPVAGVLAAAGRFALRIGLYRRRRAGGAMLTVLAVGTEEAVDSLITRTRRAPHHGLHVAAACTPAGTGPGGTATIQDFPVVGDLDDVGSHVVGHGIDTVSVAPTPGWSPARLQQLAWDLEDTGTGLVVDPGLMEIAGPRLHVASVDGMPLLRLTQPRFTGAAWLLKAMVDRGASLLLLFLVAPVLLAVSIAVALDGGPVFFRQTRIGLDGRTFVMIKFRSMCVDADDRVTELGCRDEGAGLMFKIRGDPRVTRVGAILRKYSLDELPQLFNVLDGSMSLVGPRPPLPREVARYGRDARRRLLVKPGMTGLWQVSGRSDLSWEEAIRLDLRYVENWSLALDARILLRTVLTVVRGDGAY